MKPQKLTMGLIPAAGSDNSNLNLYSQSVQLAIFSFFFFFLLFFRSHDTSWHKSEQASSKKKRKRKRKKKRTEGVAQGLRGGKLLCCESEAFNL